MKKSNTSNFLRLTQYNGKTTDFSWKIPSNGGDLYQLLPLWSKKQLRDFFPTDFCLSTIQLAYAAPDEASDKTSFWLINMQTVLTCAVNGRLLSQNNRQAFTIGDRIQIGSLIFAVEEQRPAENSQTLHTDNNASDSSAVKDTAASEVPYFSMEAQSPLSLSDFELENLSHILPDNFTHDPLHSIHIEKSENQNTEAMSLSQEKPDPSGQINDNDKIIESLHREYFDALQDPNLLSSNNLLVMRSQIFNANAQSLQDLMQQASHHDSIHDLLQPDKTFQKLTREFGELGELNDYGILQPESGVNVMHLFAPKYLQQQSTTIDFLQDPGAFQKIPTHDLEKQSSKIFKKLPTINQREHHSAVAGGLMDLSSSKQNKQDI